MPSNSSKASNKLPLVDVTIPVHKESIENIRESVSAVDGYMRELSAKRKFDFRVTVACSSCPKDTLKAVRKLKDSISNLRIVVEDKSGRGRVIKSAWVSSQSEIVMYTDVDLATGLDSIEGLLDPLLRGLQEPSKADGSLESKKTEEPHGFSGVVYGNRRLKSSSTKRSFVRRLLSSGYLWLTKLFLGTDITDMQCGFKAMPTSVAKNILPDIANDYWHFDSELLLCAQEQGIETKPVGVIWRESKATSIKFFHTTFGSLSFIDAIAKKRKRFITLERLLVWLLFVVSCVWFLSNLDGNGWGNVYYSSATMAGLDGVKPFFFGSFDSLGFVSIDKYPMVVWPSVMSTKLLGFNPAAVMLPYALAGIATGVLVYFLARKYFGVVGGVVSWIVFMFMPLSAIMYRFNNPDAYLALAGVVLVFCVMNAFETSRWRWFVLAGAVLGIAFQMKTLQSLLFVVPVVAVVVWELRYRRIDFFFKKSCTFMGVFLVTALWWPVVVMFVKPSSRPIVGGSVNNNVWDLILGYNGLSRVSGVGSAEVLGGPSATFGGRAGVVRMFNSAFFVNVGWFMLPVLIFSSFVLRYVFRHNNDVSRALKRLLLFCAVTVLSYVVVLSFSQGKIHAYYSLAMVPIFSVLVGASIVFLFKSVDVDTTKVLLWLCGVVSLSVAAVLPNVLAGVDASWHPGLFWVLVGIGVALLLLYIYFALLQNFPVVRFVFCCAMFVVFVVACFSTYDTYRDSYVGYVPTATPKAGAIKKIKPLPAPDHKLFRFLAKTTKKGNWIAATDNSFEAAVVQLDVGRPVLALGGFDGIDPLISYDSFVQYANSGDVKYFVTSRQIGSLEASNIRIWVSKNAQHCKLDTKWVVYALGKNHCPNI